MFGYKEGHRLLASSVELPNDAASLLLLNSDLVPSIDPSRADGYWTGIPVPLAKAYALMRTWPAPEIPRPGCVWTHAVLVPLGEVARFPDLAPLKNLFVRPNASRGFAEYARVLTVDAVPDRARTTREPIRPDLALRVLRAIYGRGRNGLLLTEQTTSSDALDEVVFAVWSQQWPRLRRSFSFRTAGVFSESSTDEQFDLRVVRDSTVVVSDRTVESESPEDWEKTALEDLVKEDASRFRRFIWRYGSDIRRGRERYIFLANLFQLTDEVAPLSGASLTSVLESVATVLPDAEDGKVLKNDLLSFGRGAYSLLPSTDPLDTLNYLARHPNSEAFTTFADFNWEPIRILWPQRAGEVLELAAAFMGRKPELSNGLMALISQVADRDVFLAQTRDYPLLRENVIRLNPYLLDSRDLKNVTSDELSSLLTLLPADQQLASNVLGHLIYLDSRVAAVFFTERFLDLTRGRVFELLISELVGSDNRVPRVWPDQVRDHCPDLANQILSLAQSTAGLGALAGWLGFDVEAGLRASTMIWGSAVKRVADDIQGAPRQRLHAYLLALALARPSDGCESLFEMTFDSVHADIWSSRLPYDAFAVLARFFPILPWWQQWDTCLRLRLAVVSAYVGSKLDLRSFFHLSRDADIQRQLIDIASSSKDGKRYLRRMSDS